MNPLSVIAFTGPAGSGKDTAGAVLADQRGFVPLMFAGPLKRMLAEMGCPTPASAEEKEDIIPWLGVSWRHLGQTLGTEWGRKLINDDIWVKVAEQHIRANGGRWVITDLRFENEATMIRNMGGIIVHLSGRKAKMTAKTAKHVSEAGIVFDAEHDQLLDNSGSLDDLAAKVIDIARYVGC